MDLDGDETHFEPYDVQANEPRPDSVVYTEIFRDLQDLDTKAIALLRGPLKKSKFSNFITTGLLKDIENRTKHAQSEQVIFAVAGDMKAGKSSMINSILSIGIIARKGDGGDSCTWVVQRYMKMFEYQKSPFAAKVFFFNPQQIRKIIGALLAKYYRAANKEDKDDEDDDLQGTKVESFGEMRDTLAAFTALFCDKEEFESEELASKYLQQAKSENDPKMIDELVDWAGDVVQHHLDGNDFKLIESSTPEELLWALQPYTYQVGGMDGEGEVSPWPLVSVIDFGLDHPLLNEGVVFVDSPGLSDANAVRSRNAIKHHRTCTHKLVVAEIGRVEADANVRKNLELGYRTRGSGNTLLVLTHGDSIDPDTEVTGTPSEKKRVARLDSDIKVLRTEKQKKTQERQKLRQDDRDDIDEEIRSIGAEWKQKLSEKEVVKLGMRNRKVVSKMQDLYKKLTKDPKPLSAIAVGNQVYTKYQTGFSDDEKPLLSVNETNIPALRHRLYTMPVEGRYNDTIHFAEVQLPTLVNSIELYCSQTHMVRKGEIEAIVLEPKKQVREIVRAALDQCKERAADKILTPMKLRESDWIKPARKICAAWKVTYKGKLALLRKEGHEKGRQGRKDTNWNAELADIGQDCLEGLFRDYQADSISWAHTLCASLAKLCSTTRDTLKRDRQFYTMALEPFLRNFNLKSKEFDKVLTGAARQLSREISSIHERAATSYEDSFIAKATRPIYQDAAKMKNRGAPLKRAEFVEQKVTKRNGVWLSVHDSIDTALDKLFTKCEDALAKKITELFTGLHQDFLLLCDGTEPKEEKDKIQEDITRAALKENLATVKAMIEPGGVIPKLVAQCKQYSASSNSSQLFVQ